MRAFVFAVAAALVLGVSFWLVLASVQETADVSFKTESVRN
jgi:hypothetical protein